MKAVLNIGRGIERNGQRVRVMSVAEVVAALEKRVGEIISIHAHQSASEPTLVVVMDAATEAAASKAVRELCADLEQDAIAYTLDGKGHMDGPRAAAWGPFNPAYFINPDGTSAA